MTVMDLNKRLHFLSLNLALRFAVMSSSSSSLQTMGGTTNSTPISGLVLASDRSTPVSSSVLTVEEDEDGEEVEAIGERDVNDGVYAL
ncbi:hypothetical protein PVL29_020923 [Vitis rotundifolia]|uniref:Uncharacterized protein n=1 Tax=Vitis rotundifolia TaxID=103349 RepID=A0AA38YY55_VITRO|nr:hypothetical protein PVL29_020923 [Vitis rotundifolia]